MAHCENSKTMDRLKIALAAGLLCEAAAADTNYHYVCTLSDSRRVIEVAYLVPEQAVPCEVRYQKDNEDSDVLWRADNQEGFCESKAKQLVRQQQAWGFTCTSDNLPEHNNSLSRY